MVISAMRCESDSRISTRFAHETESRKRKQSLCSTYFISLSIQDSRPYKRLDEMAFFFDIP